MPYIEVFVMWKANKVSLHFGLEKPVRILHLTDVHILLAYDHESDAHKSFTAKRAPLFEVSGRSPSELLEEAMDYGKEFDCTVVTGDVVDCVSEANYDEMRRIFSGRDFMFTLGSHEYIQMHRHEVRTHEHRDSKKEMWDELQSIFSADIGFDSRIVGGVNVITADNATFAWSEVQYKRFREEVAKGYPILIFTHTPLHMPKNAALDMYATADCHDHMVRYGFSEEEIQLSREVTDYLVNEPLVRGFFAGHCHLTMEKPYRGKPCYFTGALFQKELTEITID